MWEDAAGLLMAAFAASFRVGLSWLWFSIVHVATFEAMPAVGAIEAKCVLISRNQRRLAESNISVYIGTD